MSLGRILIELKEKSDNGDSTVAQGSDFVSRLFLCVKGREHFEAASV